MALHDVASPPADPRKAFADVTALLPPEERFPRFRDARAMLGLTQGEFAKLLKAHRVTTSEWESHKTLPGKKRLYEARITLADEFARQAIEAEMQYFKQLPPFYQLTREMSEEVRSRLVTKGALISEIVLGGAEAVLAANEWQAALGIHARVLKNLPRYPVKAREVILGWDVGIALEAAVRGLSYSQMAGRKGAYRNRAATLGRIRLVSEVHVSWALMRYALTYSLVGTEYYRIARGAAALTAMGA